MVFGLFFPRKPSQSQLEPQPPESPAPASPPDTPSPQPPPPSPLRKETHLQLRTPSPSVHGARAQGSPAPTASNLSTCMSPSKDPSALPPPPPIISPLPTPESLLALISSIPPKILHSYVLSHIPTSPDHTILSLSSFFDSLSPPPKLHCVRCHKDFVEIENDDRSCLVPHDDESALVERVGLTTRKIGRRRAEGMEYETLWGCCGKITEGNGDQGPPDGWCYEGKHTTDLKRARFRADSTPQDDKLVSCLRLNCHGIRSQLPRSAGRKRPRARINYNDQSADDEDVSEGEADSGMEEIVQGNGKPKAKPKVKTPKSVKGKAKAKEGEDVEDKMQVDDDKGMNEEEEEEDGASRTGSVRGRAKAKGKSKVAKHTLKNTSPSPKRRGRPPKSQAQLLAKELTPSTPGGSTLTPTPASSTKRRGRQFKSKEFIEDSDDEEPGTITPSVIGSTTSPEKRKRKVTGSSSLSPLRGDSPRTRSQSRTRSTGKRKLEVRTPLRPHMAKRKVVELELELGGSGDEGEGASEEENGEKEEEEKPRKKRKT